MLVGMGTVFVFLTVLVMAMSLMSAIATRLGTVADASDVTDEEIAVITAAIARHTNKLAN